MQKSMEQIQKEFEESELKMSKKFKVMGRKGQKKSADVLRLRRALEKEQKIIDNPSSSDYDEWEKEDELDG